MQLLRCTMDFCVEAVQKKIADNLTKEALEDFDEIIDMMQRNLEQ